MKILGQRTVILKMHGLFQRKVRLMRWKVLLSQFVNLLNLGIFVCTKVQGYAQSKVFFFNIYNNSNYSIYFQCLAVGSNNVIEKPNKDIQRRKSVNIINNIQNSIYQSPAQKIKEQYHQLQPQTKSIQQSVQVKCCNNIINDNILMFLNKKLNYNYKYFHRSFFKVSFKYSFLSQFYHIFQQVSFLYLLSSIIYSFSNAFV